MIKMMVIGNLGKDCTVNEVGGKTVINFSVAHSEKKKSGEAETTWVECAWWVDNANVAPYLVKGTKVYAEGKPVADAYDGKGKQRLVVFKVELLGNAQQGATQQQPATRRQPPAATTGTISGDADVNDDLPF